MARRIARRAMRCSVSRADCMVQDIPTKTSLGSYVTKMKRNHWVPQPYLRAFAADPDRKEKIWRFSKEEGGPELKPIANVAYRHYLYAPKDTSGQRDYSFEVQLSRLEQWFGERPWELLLTEHVNLGDQTVRMMASL